MKFKLVLSLILTLVFFPVTSTAQVGEGTLPVFTDYLSDNLFLLHPAAAGVGNCGKLRLTAGRYWENNELQTLSYHSKFVDNAAFGAVLFNDKNGFHSKKGGQLSYAYHLPITDANIFKQLSFGLTIAATQNQSDQRTFVGDPSVSQVILSNTFFNADFGMAYHYGGISTYLTIKNLFLVTDNSLNRTLEPANLRNYIFSLSYYFGENLPVQLEPSMMVQFRESIGQTFADVNLKAYKKVGDNSSIWAAISYRTSFDGQDLQELKQVTPIIGLNYERFMISYTYAKQLGEIQYAGSAFHQLTVGFDMFCKKPRAAACPNINGLF